MSSGPRTLWVQHIKYCLKMKGIYLPSLAFALDIKWKMFEFHFIVGTTNHPTPPLRLIIKQNTKLTWNYKEGQITFFFVDMESFSYQFHGEHLLRLSSWSDLNPVSDTRWKELSSIRGKCPAFILTNAKGTFNAWGRRICRVGFLYVFRLRLCCLLLLLLGVARPAFSLL